MSALFVSSRQLTLGFHRWARNIRRWVILLGRIALFGHRINVKGHHTCLYNLLVASCRTRKISVIMNVTTSSRKNIVHILMNSLFTLQTGHSPLTTLWLNLKATLLRIQVICSVVICSRCDDSRTIRQITSADDDHDELLAETRTLVNVKVRGHELTSSRQRGLVTSFGHAWRPPTSRHTDSHLA